jgi:hypothetical protein
MVPNLVNIGGGGFSIRPSQINVVLMARFLQDRHPGEVHTIPVTRRDHRHQQQRMAEPPDPRHPVRQRAKRSAAASVVTMPVT